MRNTAKWLAIGLIGFLVFLAGALTEKKVLGAQGAHPRVYVTRIYTGPDGLSRAEEVEAPFVPDTANGVAKLMPVTGAELHRNRAGATSDWHPGPRRQYVITLSGQGEIEVSGGKKIEVGPGHIDLIEDTTGKGHITRNMGSEDRVTLWLPIADQGTR